MTSLRAQFAGLPRVLWILFTGTVVNRIGFMVIPFLVFYLADEGVPVGQVPLVLGALGAGNLIGPILGGFLADRTGRRATMLAGLVGVALAQGALFAAPSVPLLMVAGLLLSAAGSVVSPAAYALMADHVEPERRRAGYALFGWGVNLGTAAAGVLGGFLAENGYWLLFAVDAGTALVYAAILLAALPPDRAPERAPGGSVGYGVVLRDRAMMLFLPLLGLQLFIYSLTESVLPMAVHDDGLPPSVYGAMAMVNAVVVVVFQPVATGVLARFPQLPVFLAANLLIAAGVALTGLADSAGAYALTVLVWSAGEAAVGGIAASLVANLAPAHARGRYQGAFQWTWGLARFAALTVGATVYAQVSPSAVWWSSAIGGVAAAVGVLALMPVLTRRSAPAAAAVELVLVNEGDGVTA
ncbi:MFS transporter [Actinocorallia longicatena]